MEKLIFLLFFSNVITWNFETQTAIKFKGQPGSYFGFSVAIHKNSEGILPLVAATKDDLTGALYKCNITNRKCEYVLDKGRNKIETQKNTWLGVSLDVQTMENGHVVVCGHLWTTESVNSYLPVGICYILSNDFRKVATVTPFKRKNYWIRTSSSQTGFSVSFGQDGNDNLLIGSPGFDFFTGTVLRYNFLNGKFIDNSLFLFNLRAQENDSYIGYSVSSGNFFYSDSMMYAAGAPRAGNYAGKVYIFDEESIITMELEGFQTGEYFGSSILSVDINNDKLTDLFVGAPLHSEKFGGEEGRVYVYLSQDNRLQFRSILRGGKDSKKGSRFGTSLAYIGDINHDKYSDIAIGAPYESERGAIYIYHGSPHGIKSQYVQRIFAAEIDESLMGFGISISRPVDVDSNNYPDILVGSFLSDNAILLRSRPIVRVFHNITFQPHQINPKKSSCNFTTGHCFKTIYCFGYEGIYEPLKLDFVVELRSFRRRNFLQPRDYFTDHQNKQTSFIRQEIIMKKGKPDCISYDTHVRGDSDDQVNPIQINSILFLKHNISEEVSFCKDCPILDPTFPNFTVGVISFRTGCAQSDKCSSDLKLNANISGLSNGELILGKDKEISIVAEIRHSGDPAFKTEMIIYIEENLDLIKGKYCRQSRDISKGLRLICLIGNPFDRSLVKQEIKLDSSKISSNQEHLTILMYLTTLSEEINPVDNFVNITIPIKLSADIGITGRAERELILLKKGEPSNELYEFVHIYNVMKYLYSPISLVNVVFSIPTTLIDTNTKFVKLESVKILNPDHSNSVSGICNFQNTENDHVKYDEDLNITIRSKRSINNIVMSVDVDKNLKINCETSKCQEVMCSVGPFGEKRKSSTFYIKGYINVKVLKSASKEWDNLTFTSEGRVSIIDKRRNIQPINHKPDMSKVITYIVSSITLKRGKIAKWILPVSIASGIVLITIILVVLLKMGFFRRKRREDVQMLKANLLMEKSPINEDIPDGK